MNRQENAVANFDSMNCNQAVLTVFGNEFGLSEKQCFDLGLGFGGGMGRQGKTCGTVTAAYMIIGLWCARQSNDKTKQKALAVEKITEFNRRFTVSNAGTDCRELLKYDLSIPAEAEKARSENLFNTVCPGLVKHAVSILESMLKLEKN